MFTIICILLCFWLIKLCFGIFWMLIELFFGLISFLKFWDWSDWE